MRWDVKNQPEDLHKEKRSQVLQERIAGERQGWWSPPNWSRGIAIARQSKSSKHASRPQLHLAPCNPLNCSTDAPRGRYPNHPPVADCI